jgi:hypothetical protein
MICYIRSPWRKPTTLSFGTLLVVQFPPGPMALIPSVLIDEAWAIHVSSAIWIGTRREGVLGFEGKGSIVRQGVWMKTVLEVRRATMRWPQGGRRVVEQYSFPRLHWHWQPLSALYPHCTVRMSRPTEENRPCVSASLIQDTGQQAQSSQKFSNEHKPC